MATKIVSIITNNYNSDENDKNTGDINDNNNGTISY